MIYYCRKINLASQLKIANLLGILLIFRCLWIHWYQIYLDIWTIESSLPLHLCGISTILSGIVLITKNQRAYEFLFFWGISGGYIAIITPEFTLGTQGLLFLDYYISHSGIILAPLYCTIVLKMKPEKKSWLKIFIWSQLFLPIIGILNSILNANYMYLNSPPIVENPFVLGEAPFHIIGFELAAFIHFWLLSIPFRKRYNKN